MKIILQPILPAMLAIAACSIAPAALCAEEAPVAPLSVAVLDFQDGANSVDQVGSSISALLQVHLTVHSNAILVERAELNEILAEQELTLSDAVTPSQAAGVAQLTGAEVLVSGRVFAVQNRIHVVAKVISASTSRVFGATTAYNRGEPLAAAVEKLALDIAKILSEKNTDLRVGASLEEKTIKRFKELMIDRTAGRIYIRIPEVIISSTVTDPAAQNEIARTFEVGGWEVVDVAQKADVIIRGEAFAETAVRRGNLWFTRARLEFTVTDKSGKILKTDRVVCGHVDLAQATSAKGALQKSGLLAAPISLQAWIATKP